MKFIARFFLKTRQKHHFFAFPSYRIDPKRHFLTNHASD